MYLEKRRRGETRDLYRGGGLLVADTAKYGHVTQKSPIPDHVHEINASARQKHSSRIAEMNDWLIT